MTYRDQAGNNSATIGDTTILDRACPTPPVLSTAVTTIVNTNSFLAPLDTPGTDVEPISYEKCSCLGACLAPDDCQAGDPAWTDTAESALFTFGLVRDKVNRLCIRAKDFSRTSERDCIDVTQDSIAPVTQLRCVDGVTPGGLECGTGRFRTDQDFLLAVLDRNPAPSVATYVAQRLRGASAILGVPVRSRYGH